MGTSKGSKQGGFVARKVNGVQNFPVLAGKKFCGFHPNFI